MLGRSDHPPVDWVIEDTVCNWWRPNFETAQVRSSSYFCSFLTIFSSNGTPLLQANRLVLCTWRPCINSSVTGSHDVDWYASRTLLVINRWQFVYRALIIYRLLPLRLYLEVITWLFSYRPVYQARASITARGGSRGLMSTEGLI